MRAQDLTLVSQLWVNVHKAAKNKNATTADSCTYEERDAEGCVALTRRCVECVVQRSHHVHVHRAALTHDNHTRR